MWQQLDRDGFFSNCYLLTVEGVAVLPFAPLSGGQPGHLIGFDFCIHLDVDFASATQVFDW